MRRAAATVALALAACSGGKSPPPPPTRPSVQVIPARAVTVDTQLTVDVTVSNCDSVAKLELDDGATQLAVATDAGPRTSFTFQANQVNYRQDGMAARLDLHAKATCANGQSATSDGIGQYFLPAQQVYPGNFNLNSIALDGDGQGLVVCQGGQIVRLGADGAVRTSAGSSFGCTSQGYAARGTGVHNDIYWIEPNQFARLDPTTLAPTIFTYAVSQVFLSDTASNVAVFFLNGQLMLWLDRRTGATLFPSASPLQLQGLVDGTPAFRSGNLVVPEEKTELSGTQIDLQTEIFNTSTGVSQGVYQLATTAVGIFGSPPYIPQINLSPDGNQAYFIAGDNRNELYACRSDQTCLPSGMLYRQVLSGGPYTVALPLGPSQALVLAGPGVVQFADRLTGADGGAPVYPTGGLHVQTVYPGRQNEYYVMAGAGPASFQEVIMLSAPGTEAARFTIDQGSLLLDLDSQGVPYLYFYNLAKLLTPDQYLAAKNR